MAMIVMVLLGCAGDAGRRVPMPVAMIPGGQQGGFGRGERAVMRVRQHALGPPPDHALLVASLAFLPITPSEGFKPVDASNPIGRILLLLTVTIGLPYFLLSSTTPLLQAWYWQRFRSAVPYRLFALSNFASLLALLGFPLLLEPALSLPQLGWLWSGLYAGLVILCAATA